MSTRKSRKPAKSVAKGVSKRKKKEKILIIDDEPAFVEACQRTLEAKAYKVVAASSMTQAQEKIKVEPSLIVLGTLAPAGQAFAMYQWLGQHPRYKDIPLLVIDARYEERTIRGWRRFEGIQVDGDEYLSKPIEPAALFVHLIVELFLDTLGWNAVFIPTAFLVVQLEHLFVLVPIDQLPGLWPGLDR